MDDWVWALVGVAVTLSVTVAVILWYAFKHLDDKIERLGDRLDNKLDRKFDQVMAGIAETKQLVAGHAERIKSPGEANRPAVIGGVHPSAVWYSQPAA